MVKVHINNTKHITTANIYIHPRDSTSTHYKTHVAMLTPRTPLHIRRPYRVQRYSSSMHREMEEDSLMTRYDDDPTT